MMVSPEHVDEQKSEDQQVLSPAEEKQVLPVGEKKRPWLEPLLRAVAILVSLIGGIAYVYLVVLSYSPWQENPPSDRLDFLSYVAMLLVFLVGVGAAVLFRSWWAMLFVPLAIGLGVGLTYYLSMQIAYDLLHYDNVIFGVALSILAVPIIVVIAALIGCFNGRSWKKRRKL